MSRRYPSKGWKKPKTKAAREALLEKGGAQCFLDPKALKYPVCNSRGELDCRGLVAAKARAAAQGRTALVKKADKLAKKAACAWLHGEDSVGYVDWYRVGEDGRRVHKLTDAEVPDLSAREYKLVPDKKLRSYVDKGVEKYGWRKEETRNTSRSGKWKKQGAPLFTATSKTRCPSWSLPAGSSCPAVRIPVRDMIIEEAKTGKKLTNAQLVKKLAGKVPEKCLACYATTGNYSYSDTRKAQARRWQWFNSTPDSEVINVLDDAVKHAGDEHCRKDDKGEWKCKFQPGVKPKFFRLFDSGDFEDARAVRIWREVMKRNPDIRFWAPTTAYAACATTEKDKAEVKKIMDELVIMNRLPNVTVRPSGLLVDNAAPNIPGLSPGATVVDTPSAHKHEKLNKKLQAEYIQTSDDTQTGLYHVKAYKEDIGGVKHWICPGDCSKCRKCWDKKTPVAYVLHSRKVDQKNVVDLVQTVRGGNLWEGKAEKTVPHWKEVERIIRHQLLSNTSMGPDADARAERD